MGTVTPNIAIFIPAAGETNYSESFEAGMVNIDQHDHTGGPNKGVQIGNGSIADFSITYEKLNANVVDTSTGLNLNTLLPNQIQIIGLLKNIHELSIPPAGPSIGFLAVNGTLANARSFDDSTTIEWTNRAGVSANPKAELKSTVTTSVAGTTNQIDATAAGGVQTLSLSANVVNAGQSAFKGNVTLPQNGVTGDATTYTVLFGSVAGTTCFNQPGTDYSYATSVYTAPITGNYYFQTTLALNGLSPGFGTSACILQFKVNGSADYTMFSEENLSDSSGGAVIQGNQIMRLNQNDTVTVALTVSKSAPSLSVNVIGGDFTGLLLPA